MLQHNLITNTKKGEFVPSQGMTLIVSGVAVSIRNPEKNCASIAGEIYRPDYMVRSLSSYYRLSQLETSSVVR
jgi:hypothetical protein